MDNVIQPEFHDNGEALPQEDEGLQIDAAPGPRGRAANIGVWTLLRLCFICAVSVLVIFAIVVKDGDPQILGAGGLKPSGDAQRDREASRPVIQLRYFCYHPFNLIYRMSLQSIFGLPGETVGTIPMLYSNYELEVLLRTSNSCSAPRNWTDPHAFASQEPRDAYMYAAALLTLPRTTLLYAWMYDHNGAYRILRNVHVDVLDAADRLTMGGVRAALSALGAWPARRPIANANGKAAPAPAAVTTPSAKGLGSLLWPLMVVCPGLVTCYLALALVETAPLAAGWILLTGLLKAFCEVRVLVHSGLLAWRRRPQAAVQSLACSHGVPFMLGCHALALLRVAGALLPARVFLYLSFHLYGTWVPLVSAGITLMALRPNNANFLEGAMDGLLHLGHRAAEEMHPTANGAANGGGNNTTLKNRQHWPPPVKVPAEMQESAELAPKHLLCPITHHILTEPAVTSTGATYERSAIVEWLTKAGKDPLTGRVLSPNEVFPNLAMYHVVEEYVRDSAKSQGKMSAATAAGR